MLFLRHLDMRQHGVWQTDVMFGAEVDGGFKDKLLIGLLVLVPTWLQRTV